MGEVFFSEVIKEGLVQLSKEETHHMRVKRIKKDEEVIITDGRGGVGYGRLKGIGERAEVLVERVEIEPNKENPLGLCIPLLKGRKMDELIRTSVELGVDIIYPFVSSRTVVRPKESDKKVMRWKKVIISSSKTARRFRFPRIEDIVDFDLIISLKGWETKVMLWEREKNLPLSKIAEYLKKKSLFLIGPEGGFSDEEVEKARKAGFITVSLGKRLLRSSSVPLYLLSIISFLRE